MAKAVANANSDNVKKIEGILKKTTVREFPMEAKSFLFFPVFPVHRYFLLFSNPTQKKNTIAPFHHVQLKQLARVKQQSLNFAPPPPAIIIILQLWGQE